MTLFEVPWKCDLVTLSKICLRLRPSAYLSINLRMNWIISRIPWGISKDISSDLVWQSSLQLLESQYSLFAFSIFDRLMNKIWQWMKNLAMQHATKVIYSKYSRFSNFSCMFLNPNIFLPIWIIIVLIYYIWEISRNKLKKHSVTKNCSDLSLFE